MNNLRESGRQHFLLTGENSEARRIISFDTRRDGVRKDLYRLEMLLKLLVFHNSLSESHISFRSHGSISYTSVITCQAIVFVCKRGAYLFFEAEGGSESQMAQRSDIFRTLEVMRESLRETLKETSALRHVSLEEEVLEGMENIDKTCSNALRSLKQIETLLRFDHTARAQLESTTKHS